MNLISAVIITRNEERNIARCIRSLEAIADEVVVVDSFSDDDTERICREMGANFVQREFTDYGDQKNFAVSLAKHPYVLSLDADEELSEELRNSIMSARSNLSSDAYSFNRLTNYCGHWVRHCGWYPDVKVRLWKKEKGNWEGSVHESVMVDGSIEHLKGDLLHYSFPDITSHLAKMNGYTDMMAMAAYRKGKGSSGIKMLLSPGFEFIKKYFFQLGFLDGYYGFVISGMSAYYRFLKYSKLKHLWINQPDKNE